MDISNWGWGQIMELPDHLFGRRFAIGCTISLPGAGSIFEISRMALPERAVIWEVSVASNMAYNEFGFVSLALGDQVPADDAAFDAYEQLFPDIGMLVGLHRDIMTMRNCQYNLQDLRLGVDTQGRRLVVRFLQAGVDIRFAMVNLVVSSVPRSIPEWYG